MELLWRWHRGLAQLLVIAQYSSSRTSTRRRWRAAREGVRKKTGKLESTILGEADAGDGRRKGRRPRARSWHLDRHQGNDVFCQEVARTLRT